MIFKNPIDAQLDSKSKVNAINQAFTFLQGFKVEKTNVTAQKIDDTNLENYGIVVFTFFVLDMDGR